MGAAPSREAKPTIRSLRYGNHEIGLIPITRAYFNDQNPQLRQQFIRVRNDPNVRYSHTRRRGYSMAELPPASYTEADLEALLDTVEGSLFETNEEMLDAGALPVPIISMAHLQHLLQCDGEADPYDPTLEKELEENDKPSQPPASVEPFSLGAVGTPSLPSRNGVSFGDQTSPSNPYPPRETTSWLRSTSMSLRASSSDDAENNSSFHPASTASATVSLNAAASHLLLPPSTPEAPPQSEKTAKMPSAEDCAIDWFLRLKGFLQAHHRRADESCCPTDSAAFSTPEQLLSLSQFYKSEAYRRFKRAVRPVPCALLFIYVNNREEHDCFTFQGHRVNVIGSFDMRTHDDDRDDFTPTLQIRKAILKAAGDRTLERVLALSTKYYLDSFTEIVLQQLQRRPSSELLAGLGEEARNLLCELPTSALIGSSEGCTPTYEPVSIARALFYERLTKLPLVVSSPFNNYPALKFIYDFTSLTHSIENSQFVRPGDLRLCTYEREKGERGIIFLFHGRALALSWLWATTQTQTSTVRDSWAQYTLCEHTQSRERRVQHWLATDPRAKTLLGDSAITTCFEQHLEHLHSEIVRARSTPTDDATSWSDAQEYSHDMKLYRIFLSPLCGPLLTTVKTAKPDRPKDRGNAKRSSAASSAPSTAEGSKASTGSCSTAASDLRLMMMATSGNALPSNGRNYMQARGKKSPSTPLAGLSTSGRTLSTSNFSTSAATMGGGSSTSAPLYMSSTTQGTFLHPLPPPPPQLNGDGGARAAMPRGFAAPAAFAGQGTPIAGVNGPAPIYFTDSLHLLPQGVPPLSDPQQPGCFSTMQVTSPAAGLPFSMPSPPWPLHPFIHSPQPPQPMASSPSQASTTAPTSYVVQVSSNGVQTLMPITFASAPTSHAPNWSSHADAPQLSHTNGQSAPQCPPMAPSFSATMTMANGKGDTSSLSSSQQSSGSKSTPYAGAASHITTTPQNPHSTHSLDSAATASYYNMGDIFATGHGGAPITTLPHSMSRSQTTAPVFAAMQPSPAQLASNPTLCYAAHQAYVPIGYFSTSVSGSPHTPQ
ncbi:hypothetical protein LSCM1_06415 [Leishmania martiniquensis]|uniref:Uncharacterized protein n=1 Tax=Leishmania martiniquensis TaxID=1580590 RepID=A0A836HL61_9TRYP|nr:hypothetical protein LSCM1_06415 [Leishmania martiniquensis]